MKLLAIIPIALLLAGCGSNTLANSTVTERAEVTVARDNTKCKQVVDELLTLLTVSNKNTKAALNNNYTKSTELSKQMTSRINLMMPLLTACRDS